MPLNKNTHYLEQKRSSGAMNITPSQGPSRQPAPSFIYVTLCSFEGVKNAERCRKNLPFPESHNIRDRFDINEKVVVVDVGGICASRQSLGMGLSWDISLTTPFDHIRIGPDRMCRFNYNLLIHIVLLETAFSNHGIFIFTTNL